MEIPPYLAGLLSSIFIVFYYHLKILKIFNNQYSTLNIQLKNKKKNIEFWIFIFYKMNIELNSPALIWWKIARLFDYCSLIFTIEQYKTKKTRILIRVFLFHYLLRNIPK